MNRSAAAAVVSALVLVSGAAHAYRDDLPLDPVRDCASATLPASNEYRDHCALAAIERACASDPATLTAEVARILGVTGVQVNKAAGRHTLASLERGGLCERPESERRLVLGASRQAKKVPSQAAQEFLLRELGGPSGAIDPGAVAAALEQRDIILNAPHAKRAGLPALPTGWTNLTGYTQSPGRINHILFTDVSGDNILAGADGGGIWRTTNGGALWTPVNDFLGSLSITNLARATNNATTLYAATNASGSHSYFPFGIVKSTDGGNTWAQLANTDPALHADFEYVQRVAVHPTNPLIVLAATKGGAYQSVDGGASWTKVGPATLAFYVAFHPNDGNRRAVGYNDGTIRYTTNGDLAGAGALTTTVLAGGNYTKLAYAKSDVNRMYALVTDGATGATRLFMSVTGGGSWTEVSATPLVGNGTFYNSYYLRYTGGLWVDPLNANRVAVFEAWTSFTPDITAAPTVWRKLANGWVDYHGVVEHPAYDGGANRTVFVMDDGGLYRVGIVDNLDDTAQFTRIEAGLAVTQVYSVAAAGGNPIMGAQDVGPKVYRLDPAFPAEPIKWRFLRRPPGDAQCPNCSWIGDGMTVAASTTDPAVMYGSRQYLDLFRSNDGGVTATSLAHGSALTEGLGATAVNFNAGFLAPFVLDPSNQSRMYAGGMSLWRTNDADTGTPPAWTSIRGPAPPDNCGTMAIGVIAVAPSDPNVVWIAYQCDGRVFKSVDALQPAPTWTALTFPAAMNFRAKGSIMIDRNDPAIVWIGIGQYSSSTLFKTLDGGTSWTAVAGLPGAPVYTLLQHPASTSWLYAGTGVGLFASTDGGATWSTSNEGPANVIVNRMAWNGAGTSPELFVATHGRGVYKSTVTFAVAPDDTPDAFSFASQSDVPIGGTVVSAAATITGITVAASVTVLNGEYSIGCTGTFTNAAGSIANGQTICVRHIASGTAGGGVTTTLTIGGVSGTFTSTAAAAPSARLANLSTRMQVLTGNDVMIGGFVIGGSVDKTVVVRARGPSLVPFGITNALANPTLQLVRSSDQTTIALNDNWGSAANAAALTATGFAPSNGLESAILVTLAPGAYTAIVSGVGNTTGVGIVEVFEVDTPEAPLVNISTRGQVRTGNDVMIGGFVIQGTAQQTVVVRARGPSLIPFGITNALANPFLQLVRSSDQVILATNDNWGSAANAAALNASGFAPGNPLESAILITLDPGAYTVIVSGVAGGTGVGIVEVFAQ